MGLFDDFFGGDDDKSNPADAAMPYLQQIPGMEKQYYNPYIDRGTAAYGTMNPVYQKMSSDPSSFLNALMSAYKPSANYNMQEDEMTRAAGNSAAAGGMRGGIEDIKNQARITDTLMGKDMQDWLGNVLGIQKSGLEGEQGLYNTGFDATRDLAGDLSNVMGTEGSLAFQGQKEQNQRQSDLLSGLMKLVGAGAGAYLGGPKGAAVGANVGGSFF